MYWSFFCYRAHSPYIGQPLEFASDEDVNNVTGLLKLYVRSLPQPLLLFDNYETIIACCRGTVRAYPLETLGICPAHRRSPATRRG